MEESQAAQSTADFIHKLEIALAETRETRYWLRLLIAVELFTESRLRPLLDESEELLKIIASIVVKTKRNRPNSKLWIPNSNGSSWDSMLNYHQKIPKSLA